MIRMLKRYLVSRHVNNNINKCKREGESLVQERILINALMDNIPDHIYFKNTDSRFIRINKALARYFKLNDPAQAIGKTDFDFFTKEHAQQAFDDELMIIRTGQPLYKEEKETREAQSDSWVSTVKMPLRDAKGKIIGTFGISRDITHRILAEFTLKEKNEEIEAQNEEYLQINEELQQSNEELTFARAKAEESDRLKTAFLANMSHEIRTPMNAVMGFANLMAGQFDNKQRLEEYSQIIIQSCSDLIDVINEVLDIAKIESGQLPVNFEECKLDLLLSEILTFFKEYQERLNKQHIELNLQEHCDLSGLTIITDKVKLKQIFINLIGNAFKFTDKGKIQVGCKLIANQELIFHVSDTGMGIPANKQAFIFERFTQVEQGINRTFRGTGLGLSIVKGLVNLLGGKIWVESEPGKGSTFYFSIPYKTVTSQQKETSEDYGTNQYQFINKTLLIVEDDPYSSLYLNEILVGCGFNILQTNFGKEAVEISANQPVDIVLMDLRLPDIEGYEAAQMIKRKRPDIKIIAQTAYETPVDEQKALESGCDEYISKPLSRNLLLAKIKEQLDKRRISGKT